MSNLTESATWEAGVYQLETTDPVLGGPEGIDNLQAKQLANRTTYLKALVDALGTGKQPIDATLTALAALVTAADKIIYATANDTFATTSLTAFMRTLLDDVDAAAARATLGAASPADIATAIANLVESSPAALDTLNELAVALGNDPNFATTITNALALKAPLASPVLTGTPSAPTPATSDESTKLATSAFVKNVLAVYGIGTSDLADNAADMNTITAGGFYICTGANSPGGGAWFVIVMTNAYNHSVQYAVAQGATTLYMRTSTVGVWSAWRTVAFTDSPDFTGAPKLPSGVLIKAQDGASEGGELLLEKSPGSTLSGNVAIDLNGNSIRIFENGGTGRGITINIANLAAAAGSTFATVADIATAIANLVASSPAALDTLNELAVALGNDANFATTITNALAGKASLSGADFSGAVLLPSLSTKIKKRTDPDYGGGFYIEKSPNGTLGADVLVQMVGNDFQVIEAGGTFRGVSLDLSAMAGGGVWRLITDKNTATLENKTIALGLNQISGTAAQFNAACSDGDFAFMWDRGSLNGAIATPSSLNLSTGSLGSLVIFYSATAAQQLTLPAVAGIGTGAGYWFVNQGTVPVTVKANAAEVIRRSTFAAGMTDTNTIILSPGDSVFVLSQGGIWAVYGFLIADMLLFGVNQTWQNMTASRAAGTTYTNTTGKPISIAVRAGNVSSSAQGSAAITVAGEQISYFHTAAEFQGAWGSTENTQTAVVPPGATYSVALSNAVIVKWSELR